MTQDQYGQARGPGYVVRGDVVPDDENEEFPTDESKPMTRFQKVASALRGGGPEQDEQDQTAETGADPLTRQDAADHPATQPDMFGTSTHAGNGATPTPQAGVLGDFSDLTYGDLLPDAAQYTAQWQQVQFKFVDDPRASVTEAADIIAQVTARLEAAIQERQRAIEERQRAIAEQQRSLRDRWGEGTNADTEGLRKTLRMYRTFLDQLIGPRAG
jgi:hypothetical protein